MQQEAHFADRLCDCETVLSDRKLEAGIPDFRAVTWGFGEKCASGSFAETMLYSHAFGSTLAR